MVELVIPNVTIKLQSSGYNSFTLERITFTSSEPEQLILYDIIGYALCRNIITPTKTVFSSICKA